MLFTSSSASAVFLRGPEKSPYWILSFVVVFPMVISGPSLVLSSTEATSRVIGAEKSEFTVGQRVRGDGEGEREDHTREPSGWPHGREYQAGH